MLTATVETREATQSLLNTALRVRNEGLEERFVMSNFICDTTACLAGWHVIFVYGHEQPKLCGLALDFSEEFCESIFPTSCIRTKRGDVWCHLDSILFGGGQGKGNEALTKQIRKLRWLLNRIDVRLEYDRVQALPRHERRLAA